MKILILGSGGREHAFAWKIAQSRHCEQLYILPGNAGTSQHGINLEGSQNDFETIKKRVLELSIDLVLVGPEEPLVNGIHDFFVADQAIRDIPVIGPLKRGAQLEGSKDFSKKFMARNKIPTAAYLSFGADQLESGLDYLDQHSLPIVLKADGLAAGKGVIITSDREEAKAVLRAMLSGESFGEAGKKVVVEQFLEGIELSVFVLSDGRSYKVLPSAKDYKRIGEGDTGQNTGGMGSVSPVPFATEEFLEKVNQRIILPTLEGLKEEGIIYTGFLFIGLIKVGEEPYVIEYNVRMGDPETESVIPRIKTDFVELMKAVAEGNLDEVKLEISEESAATIVLVSGGYPGDYQKNVPISGSDQQGRSIVFHAGSRKSEGQILTNGGRVLAVTSLAPDLKKALDLSLQRISEIHFEGMNFRRDIGLDVIL